MRFGRDLRLVTGDGFDEQNRAREVSPDVLICADIHKTLSALSTRLMVDVLADAMQATCDVCAATPVTACEREIAGAGDARRVTLFVQHIQAIALSMGHVSARLLHNSRQLTGAILPEENAASVCRSAEQVADAAVGKFFVGEEGVCDRATARAMDTLFEVFRHFVSDMLERHPADLRDGATENATTDQAVEAILRGFKDSAGNKDGGKN